MEGRGEEMENRKGKRRQEQTEGRRTRLTDFQYWGGLSVVVFGNW